MRSRKITLIFTYLINDSQIMEGAYQRSIHQNHSKELFFLKLIDYSDLSSTSSRRKTKNKKRPTNLCKLKMFSWNPSKPNTAHFSGASCSFMSIFFLLFLSTSFLYLGILLLVQYSSSSFLHYDLSVPSRAHYW